jgi:hypothetical protein
MFGSPNAIEYIDQIVAQVCF